MNRNNSLLTETEAHLIKGCLAGDRASQSRLYNLYAPEMMGVCMRYAPNRQEAEEILQEGFFRVFKYIHHYKAIGPFKGWIRKIMVNCALFRYKSNSKLRPLILLQDHDQPGTDDPAIFSHLAAKDLMQLVQALPAAYRMVFNLFTFEGMKHREIAGLLGITEGTSKSNLFQAKALLQKTIVQKKINSL